METLPASNQPRGARSEPFASFSTENSFSNGERKQEDGHGQGLCWHRQQEPAPGRGDGGFQKKLWNLWLLWDQGKNKSPKAALSPALCVALEEEQLG